MALVSRITVTLTAALSAALDLVTSEANLTKKKTQDLASGTGANQADRVFSDTRSIAASTTEDIDLSGALLDALGGPFVLAKLKAILIVASALNVNDIHLGGDAASVPIFGAVADFIVIKPGGIFLWTAPAAGGVAVTAATGDILQLANSGADTAVAFDIVLIGTSA